MLLLSNKKRLLIVKMNEQRFYEHTDIIVNNTLERNNSSKVFEKYVPFIKLL